MRTIHRWQYQYLGATTLPKILGVVEIESFFTFSAWELSHIRSRYKENHRIAVAIQIGFMKMTGRTMDAIRMIPPTLLKHVGAQLGLAAPTIASLRAIYRRRSTLYEHQAWAMEIAKFQRPSDKQFSRLLPFLRGEALHCASTDALVERGKVWLYQHGFIYPGDRPIRDYAREALTSSEETLLTLILDEVPRSTLSRWQSELLAVRQNGRTFLEWLQEPIRRKSVPAIAERIDRIQFLRNLGVDGLKLPTVPLEKIRAYASDLRRLRPAKVRELREPMRTLRLVCFAKISLMQITDTAVQLAGRQVAKVVREAYDKARLLEAETTLNYRDVVMEIFETADQPDLSDAEFRQFVLALREKTKGPEFPTRAAAARWLMSEKGTQVHPLLTQLQKLDLMATPDNEVASNWEYIKGCYRGDVKELDGNAGIHYGKPWSSIIEGPDRERALRAVEAATLLGIRKGLRSGALWIEHSETYRNRDSLLIDSERWAATRRKRYTQLNLPLKPDEYLDRMVAALEAGLQRVDAALEAGEISIQDGTIRIPKLKAVPESAEANQARDALFEQIGVVQFPDLILQVDSMTGFSRAILGRHARSTEELLKVYGGMLAHGTSLDATGVSLMIPELSPAQITSGMQLFEDAETLRVANETVASFQRRLPVASIWGDGTLMSADMMSLDVSQKIWAARLDPKRNVASVGTYTHVSDSWSLVYDQPILLNERQAGAAIEGVIRQREIDVERLAVDTHGYTDFAMGQAKLLGFDLCPRLKRLSERKFHIPRGIKVPKSLAEVVLPTVALRKIPAEWDQLVRIAASIETGQTTATIALARFGSAAAADPVYRAGVSLGRLQRSIYLCDYFSSEPFRRMINRILVHGESVHQLQRAIYTGTLGKPRGQRHEELIAMSGSLTLLTNLCLAWTAARIQDTLDSDIGAELKKGGLEWMRVVSPAHFANINFRGKFSFPFDQYEERLFYRGGIAVAA